MSDPYRWIANQQVVEQFVRLKSFDRQYFLDQFDQLAANPFQVGDTSLSDAQGRDVQVKILGRFVVEYWADHATKELRVVSLDSV